MLYHPNPPRATAMITLALALITLVAACGGSSAGGRPRAGACVATPTDSLVAAAVDHYVDQLTPKPERFLVMASGDSALPEAGRVVLQDKGPMFLFPADPAKQPEVIGSLIQKGSYVTLLVLYEGTEQAGAGRATVRLGGRYVGAPGSETDASALSLPFECADGKWRSMDAEEPRGT